MRSKITFDERQLKLRSEIFQRGFFLLFILVFMNTILSNIEVVWAVNNWSYFIIAMFALSFCLFELILREVAFSAHTKNRVSVMMIAVGIMGLVLLLFSIFAPAHVGFFENNMLSALGGGVITGSMFTAVGVVFVLKTIQNKCQLMDE